VKLMGSRRLRREEADLKGCVLALRSVPIRSLRLHRRS
jgi:hypothetical protein